MFDAEAVIDDTFGTFGIAATYTPAGGGVPVAISVIPRREDVPDEFAGGRSIVTRGLFEVRASELTPDRDGTLLVAGVTWAIKGPPEQLDPDRLVWTLRCAPV